MVDLADLTSAVEAGNRGMAVAVTRSAIDAGLPPAKILDAMMRAMDVVGAKFQQNLVFVPELLISARAMKEATELLEPLMVNAGIKPAHTAVIGTVKGDLHDIGKNLLGMMWKGANIAVVDLGVNVPPEQFSRAAAEHSADLIGVSALLTTTMVNMKDVVDVVHAAGLSTRLMVGGAPLTSEFAASIGADGYAPDAASAVTVAKELPWNVRLRFSRGHPIRAPRSTGCARRGSHLPRPAIGRIAPVRHVGGLRMHGSWAASQMAYLRGPNEGRLAIATTQTLERIGMII